MKLISRTRLSPAELAEVEQARIRAEDERRRLARVAAQEQADADRAARRAAERERARAEKKARKAKAKARTRRHAALRRWADTARYVAPLLLVNLAAVGGQTAYAFTRTPAAWHPAARIAVALVYAATVESISLYVNWHAHDALLQSATGTAAEMRRRAYLIAGIVGAMNYSHFDGPNWTPTPFAVGSGMASLLSPWLWGLHTRRAQHVQLLRKDLLDETGAVFDRKRRRAFPIRTWKAERWSIEHNVRDPREAWAGYHAHRDAQRAARAGNPGSRLKAAWAALRGQLRAPAETVDESDPGIRECRKLERGIAAARVGLAPQMARIALAERALGVWPPAGAPLPAILPAIRPAVPVAGAADPARKVPAAPAPAGGPELPARAAAPVPATTRPKRATVAAKVGQKLRRRAPKQPTAGTDAERTRAAYDAYLAEHGRAPSDRKLAALAGVGKTYANEWKKQNAK
ncbi:hypothetical protein [Micromonospora sp. KC213]|uniref:hypothetical protein n=1 Tax=Micromonospora sp. KC213 TaxID=2530378 RepID=UPI00104540EB|nr:hypothetical protein [Micromonospora sp. KC213]TDC42105.1 hypothetical protein E1166_09110 [Micromonospora sp. KC213]